MVYVTFFITMTLFVYSLFVFRSEKQAHVNRRVSKYLTEQTKSTQLSKESEEKTKPFRSLSKRLFKPAWLEVKRSFKRKMPGDKEAKVEIKLLQAGSPFGMTPVEFRLLQISLFILTPIVFGLYGKLIGAAEGGQFLWLLIGLGVAAWLPHFYLNRKIKSRNRLAIRELPDILDLLTVSLEAGLGFDSALSKVVSKKSGVLAGEFHRVLEEIRLGKTRREALTGVRERVTVDEISMLISSIVQAEKLGIGMVQVLRTQSNEVRHQRKQRAEEEAMKAPIKMLFPLVLFIFPSLFIVLLGPAVLEFISTFNQ